MKLIKFFLIGVFFGIVLIKAEVASWFRIYEMFNFQNIHMFGIIGVAIGVGALSVFLIKKFNVKSVNKEEINLSEKPFIPKAQLIGGAIFGLGWALTGACPGPLYALIGAGNSVIFIPLAFALLGAFVYGVFKDKLPL